MLLLTQGREVPLIMTSDKLAIQCGLFPVPLNHVRSGSPSPFTIPALSAGYHATVSSDWIARVFQFDYVDVADLRSLVVS